MSGAGPVPFRGFGGDAVAQRGQRHAAFNWMADLHAPVIGLPRANHDSSGPITAAMDFFCLARCHSQVRA